VVFHPGDGGDGDGVVVVVVVVGWWGRRNCYRWMGIGVHD